jgi:hypothetical protein
MIMKCLIQFAVILIAIPTIFGQKTETGNLERHVGVIKSINAGVSEFIIAPDEGGEMRVIAGSGASLLRVAPGDKDLSKAAKILMEEIAAGDRVLIRGKRSSEGILAASIIVVISKADLAHKHEAEQAEWKRRGISGRISAIDAIQRKITISPSSKSLPPVVTISLAENAIQKRYRPDSIRFDDAVASTLDEIRVGDQIHVLVDKNTTAEYVGQQIVSGTFRTFVAVVVSADSAGGAFSAKERGSEQPFVARVSQDSILRKLTPAIAKRLTQNELEEESKSRSSHSVGETSAPRGPSIDTQTILEKASPLSLGDLRPGDAIIISCTATKQTGPITAFAVLAGAEPLLEQSTEEQQELLGSWELGLEPSSE